MNQEFQGTWDRIINLVPWIREKLWAWLEGDIPESVIVILDSIFIVGFIISVVMTLVIGLIWMERRLLGWFQVRYGPNRNGPAGIGQPVADAIKFLFKEVIEVKYGQKLLLWLSPILLFFSVFMAFAVLPIGFGKKGALANLDIGILYLVAMGSIGVIGVLIGGWGSRNKWSLLGSMRAVAQMVSYEIPMVLSVVGIILIVGSMNIGEIVSQQGLPFIFVQPLGFLLYFISAIAELNRTPMDQIEAESELTTGYFTEYSGMWFATFFLAEYINAFVVSCITTTLFLGGWKAWPLPGDWHWLPGGIVFLVKALLVFAFIIWMRATLPRLRIDQIMAFSWKFLIPVALINIFITAGEVLIGDAVGLTHSGESILHHWWMALVNIPLAIGIVVIWSKLFFKLGGGRVEFGSIRHGYRKGDASDTEAPLSAQGYNSIS